MRVYLAGRLPMGRTTLESVFADCGVEPGEVIGCVPPGEELVGRLELLKGCDAILLPGDWRCDLRTRIEKETADYLHIPQVQYYLPRIRRGREVNDRDGKHAETKTQGTYSPRTGGAAADGDRGTLHGGDAQNGLQQVPEAVGRGRKLYL